MIKTKRLTLHSFLDKDYELMKEMLGNEEISKTYMIPDLKCEEDYFRIFNSFKNLSLKEDRFVVGIYLDEVLIGFINDTDIKEHTIELGYVINPKYKNNGYATEALVASINALFKRDFNEVICGAFEDNEASIKVMINAGMKKINKKEDIEYRGNVHHCIFYSIREYK